ncbi:hypothetical protein SAMN04488564_107362 [Lentzea waywayandensis]|uniref:Uncharacterized protein n=1 Tax=Lentzea waywayandensis TaxID=84724 RepID=A0A1I6F2L2_9PSEU|nr:hypothetical protein SAMN04488564_107362 [Lentzea waywayandensis]
MSAGRVMLLAHEQDNLRRRRGVAIGSGDLRPGSGRERTGRRPVMQIGMTAHIGSSGQKKLWSGGAATLDVRTSAHGERTVDGTLYQVSTEIRC